MSADFWAGYISGAAGIVVGNPLDLIKTRLQAGQVHEAHPTSVASLRTTFDRAGTLVKGATAPILGYGALNALLFVTYNRSLSYLSGNDPAPTYLQTYVAGALGGFATFFVSAPTELIKVRAQLANDGTPNGSTSASRSSSLWIVKETWKREGLRGLYLGGGVTAWRDAVGYGFYFCSYDFCKKLMSPTSDPSPDQLPQWKIMLCGGIAGIVTWASIFPLDVIKTRIQSQALMPTKSCSAATAPLSAGRESLINSHSPTTDYGVRQQPAHVPTSNHQSTSRPPTDSLAVSRPSTLAITRQVYQTEGISVFFRGLGICSVRAFIVNAVQWAVYEWIMVVLVPKKGAQHI